MDLSTSVGFSNALWAIARLRPGAGHLTAPVCSTFVIVFPGSSFIYHFVLVGGEKNLFLKLQIGPQSNLGRGEELNQVNYLRSRGSTHRSPTKPLGRSDSQCVRLGNLLCARALIQVVLAASKGCWRVLEQPMSSVMEYHPLFQAVVKLLGMRKLLISMSKFGRPTEKKTWLYSSSSVYLQNHDVMCFCFGYVLVCFIVCFI